MCLLASDDGSETEKSVRQPTLGGGLKVNGFRVSSAFSASSSLSGWAGFFSMGVWSNTKRAKKVNFKNRNRLRPKQSSGKF